MSKAKHAEPILQTIDQLRCRKARPDLSRICHMVERRHGLSAEEVESNLAIMVAENMVVKVNYKGSVSYRNPAKWKRRKRGDQTESTEKKTVSVMRTKLPKKKLLKLKTVKALTKPKGKRGRPPLKKKAKVKPPSDIDEETEEEVLDESITAGVDADTDSATAATKTTETDTSKKSFGKSDTESVLDTSADEATGTRSSKAGIGRQSRHRAFIRYELVKGKRGDSKNSSKTSAAESDQAASENGPASADVGAITDESKLETTSKVVSPKKIKLITNKRKKFKKNLGPDFHSYSILKKGSREDSEKTDANSLPSPSDTENKDLKCDYCLRTAASNRNEQPEDLLICKDCQAKAHPSCMDYSEELARRASRSPWQCIDCKTCNVCNDSGDADAMLFCDACDKGYHMNCHKPPIKEKPKGKWVCCQCVLELGVDSDQTETGDNNEVNPDLNMDESVPVPADPAADGGGASFLPTPNESPVHFNEEADSNKMSSKLNPAVVAPLPRLATTLTSDIPDASNWTILDVVKFFAEMGFIEQAEAFREQEIDGRALLLMTRMDVLTGLSIKLGPALKIYVHIQRLQGKHLNGL